MCFYHPCLTQFHEISEGFKKKWNFHLINSSLTKSITFNRTVTSSYCVDAVLPKDLARKILQSNKMTVEAENSAALCERKSLASLLHIKAPPQLNYSSWSLRIPFICALVWRKRKWEELQWKFWAICR